MYLGNIIYAVKANEKRMSKLASIHHRNKRFAKAKAYVIAEARAQKTKLSSDDIEEAAYQIVKGVMN